ncbi:MAG: DUF3459 domain-containing protein, partial [Phaeodactylibacter sp.]|nr:DUF3459 domain-containing protein [Phaeodactylibacter sp.]
DGDPSDGVDGYRLDVAAEVPLDFWREYRRVVRAINPDAYLIGELWWERWPDQLLDPAPALQGDVFDASMNYRWYRVARHFFNAAPGPMPVSAFVDSLQQLFSGIRPQNNAAMMNLGASHDAPRMLTSFFNQNKYKHNCSPGADPSYKIHRPDAAAFERLLLLLVHQYTYIGAPHIWAGDEMGMWGADDQDSRKPLIWPDLEFEPEQAHPLGLQRPVDEVRFDEPLYDFYRKLIYIRKSHPALVHGTLDYLVTDDEQGVLAYRRQLNEAVVVVVFNNSRAERTLQNPLASPCKDLITGEQFGPAELSLPAWSARILVPEQ